MDDKNKYKSPLTESEDPSQLRGVLDQVKIIATGGMAQIFRARQPSLERYVVVKKLKDELMTHPETLERFRREARALAAVLHQNVAHVYDFVENGKESYLLMEYIDGIDLSTVIQKVGHLPPDVACSILLGVAQGVSYIHAHHLIHRDIKPGNIRISTRGNVKLMDFGIVMDTSNESITRPGMMIGSPCYLSPEQVVGDPITPVADVFLLGICLYEMLTGVKPFSDDANQTVFQKIRQAKYSPAKQMNSAIPSVLDRMVKRCLEKDARNRYQTVKELIVEVERFLGPQRSSHSEDIILKFFDEEALLRPVVPYSELQITDESWFESFSIRHVVMALFIVTLFFGMGWYGAKKYYTNADKAATGYAAPKSIR